MQQAHINYNSAEFFKSAHLLSQLPPDTGCEIAFVGRSNAGKSSTLNAITGIQNLAKTSKTPGRTQLINLFTVPKPNCFLVDLPGYGYAKIPQSLKAHWKKTLAGYFETRQSIKGVILITDIRHPLTELDQQMLVWCTHQKIPVHVLLNKADKLKWGQAKTQLLSVQKQIETHYENVSLQLFSAAKKTGLSEVKQRISTWFNTNEPPPN